MYKKILVPLDGSELAECALSHVKNLVKEGAAKEVIILNVFKIYTEAAGILEGAIYINIDETRSELSAASKKYLTTVASRLASDGINVKVESLEGGSPTDTLSEYAQKKGVDMIIMATHGYTGIKKLRFGSVALGVLHESHVPILLIRPEP
jgi:nucleotide-binding universal stress UspA family protein